MPPWHLTNAGEPVSLEESSFWLQVSYHTRKKNPRTGNNGSQPAAVLSTAGWADQNRAFANDLQIQGATLVQSVW